MEHFTGLSQFQVPVQQPSVAPFVREGIRLNVIRFDLMDTITGGNKWFKLSQYLLRAQQNSIRHLVSFGGAYSNHIAALAGVGERYSFKTTGIIRGEEVSNLTLDRARRQGMELRFVSRGLYRELRAGGYDHPFMKEFEDAMVIPEGGNGTDGIAGAAAMHAFIPAETTDIMLAAGTGATAAGIASRLLSHQQLHVVMVARNEAEISALVNGADIHLHTGFHFGGYAKTRPELLRFCEDFTGKSGIPIEPIYTGKLFFAVDELWKSGAFGTGSVVSVLHTGGLQYQNS